MAGGLAVGGLLIAPWGVFLAVALAQLQQVVRRGRAPVGTHKGGAGGGVRGSRSETPAPTPGRGVCAKK